MRWLGLVVDVALWVAIGMALPPMSSEREWTIRGLILVMAFVSFVDGLHRGSKSG